MKKIKFINSTTIFIYNEDKDQEGITEWFNFKGLTFVEYNPSIWSYL